MFIKHTEDKKGRTHIIEGDEKSGLFSIKRFICEVQQQETEEETQEVADLIVNALNK